MNSVTHFTQLLAIVTEGIESKNILQLRAQLIQLFDQPLTFLQLTKAKNLAKRLNLPKTKMLKLAILSDSTTDHLKQALEVHLNLREFDAKIYESPFDTIEQEILNPNSEFYAFAPTHVLIMMNSESLGWKLQVGASDQEIQEVLEKQWSSLTEIWARIRENLPTSQIMQSTFATPMERPLGNLETRIGFSDTNLTGAINQKIRNQNVVTVLDLEYLSTVFGKKAWFDCRLWFHSKHPFSLDAHNLVCAEVSRLLTSMSGNSRKCLVLDLDDTLWGGVIGDDGLDGIKLGECAIGEAFESFQKYVRKLKERGVILAVCSKNNEETALHPFQRHPHMVLKREDISMFVVNWENKADNIKHIANTLNIGLDSLVFFDDNPAERKIVRDFLPEVYTVEVPEDPSDYVSALDSLGLFDVMTISREDTLRTDHYLKNAAREVLRNKSLNLDDYLQSLEMKCIVTKVHELNFERPLQLINKSNQFNLMTNRYTESEFKELLSRPEVSALSFRLIDKFADNGEICVVITEGNGSRLRIRDWVMSCRVLSRGMEDFTLNAIRKLAQDTSKNSVVGCYRATPKNSLVAKLLLKLGFELVDKTETEEVYNFDIGSSSDLPNFIVHQKISVSK